MKNGRKQLYRSNNSCLTLDFENRVNGPDSKIIVKQKCQKATCSYKHKNI